MRTRAPSLVPDEQPYDVAAYIVVNDYGQQLGRTYAETDEAKADEKTVLSNISGGEYSDPIRVVVVVMSWQATDQTAP
jgi:hypothetical protein